MNKTITILVLKSKHEVHGTRVYYAPTYHNGEVVVVVVVSGKGSSPWWN